MQYKKILVPIDGSDSSLRALQTAIELAKDAADTSISAVRVVPPLDPSMMQVSVGTDPFDATASASMMNLVVNHEAVEELRKAAKIKLEELVAGAVEGMEDRVATEVVECGSVSMGIIDYAETNGCDFIVMGSRGLGKIRSILGSVSYSVLQSSEVPVTIVK